MAQVPKPITFSADTTILSSKVNENFDGIYDEFNGNIDNGNIKAGAAIATAKLASDAGIVNAMIADSTITPTKTTNPYKFSVYRNAALTPGTADIIFDTENFDTNNNFDTTNGRYTAPVDGYYQLNAQIALTTTGANLGFGVDIKKNGTAVASWRSVMMYAGAYTHTATISTLVYATAGQYFTVTEGASSSRPVVTGASNTYFNGFLVSRT